MIHRHAFVIGLLALTVLAGASAQSMSYAADPAVPPAFNGRLYVWAPEMGREVSSPIEMEVTEQNEYGIFSGRFSSYSPTSGRPEVLCSEGVRLPMSGFYNGEQLSFTVKQSAKHDLCRDFHWRLNRRQDGSFHAEGASWRLVITPVGP